MRYRDSKGSPVDDDLLPRLPRSIRFAKLEIVNHFSLSRSVRSKVEKMGYKEHKILSSLTFAMMIVLTNTQTICLHGLLFYETNSELHLKGGNKKWRRRKIPSRGEVQLGKGLPIMEDLSCLPYGCLWLSFSHFLDR